MNPFVVHHSICRSMSGTSSRRELVGVLALEALEPGHDDKTTDPRPAFRGWEIELLDPEGNIGLGRAPWEEGELLAQSPKNTILPEATCLAAPRSFRVT